MTYLGPQLTGASAAIDNIGWNVSNYTKCVHSFYTSGSTTYDVYSFSIPGPASIVFTQSVANASLLVIGGGGGGGSVIGGGGGGGEVVSQTATTLNGAYTINVGIGGIGGVYQNTTYWGGVSGEATTITGTNVNITAKGGGGGGGYSSAGTTTPIVSAWGLSPLSYGYSPTNTTSGAHGGGTGAGSGAGIAAGTGFNAGGGIASSNYGGGGGGAGGVGAAGTTTAAGAGGLGLASSITGSSVSYAGGGGGGIRNAAASGASGNGGGGNGGYGTSSATAQGGNGVRGAGGGAGGWLDTSNPGNLYQSGGKGGDGMVIISVPRAGSNANYTLFSIPAGASGYIGNPGTPFSSVTTSVTPSTITFNGLTYSLYTFTSTTTATFSLSSAAEVTARVLVVGGGGGGGQGASGNGGGGAGGYNDTSMVIRSGVTYTITVGGGGNANANGTTSSITASSGQRVAGDGGGTGGGYGVIGAQVGGSGGGGWYYQGAGAAGIAGLGYAGGTPVSNATGGGGGASQPGFSGVSSGAGNGGNGLPWLDGVIRGGGGGGGNAGTEVNCYGLGGTGGGGNGIVGSGSGSNGSNNTGGGGGACYVSGTGGKGGSGIVLIAIPNTGQYIITAEYASIYYNGWTKKQSFTITNSGSTYTNYAATVTVTYASSMKSNFSDVRFAQIINGYAIELSCWIQSYTDSSTATFWIRVPSLPNGSSTIYMYYGNSSISSGVSSLSSTFPLFSDDFEYANSVFLSRWTNSGNATGTDSLTITPWMVASSYPYVTGSAMSGTQSMALRGSYGGSGNTNIIGNAYDAQSYRSFDVPAGTYKIAFLQQNVRAISSDAVRVTLSNVTDSTTIQTWEASSSVSTLTSGPVGSVTVGAVQSVVSNSFTLAATKTLRFTAIAHDGAWTGQLFLDNIFLYQAPATLPTISSFSAESSNTN